MSIREYLSTQLQSFDLNEAVMADIAMNIDLEREYSVDVQKEVGVALTGAIEQFLFSPRMTNISENGFSQSWNYDNIGKYYLWLCRRWGVIPNKETVAASGLSVITDKTNSW